MDELYYILTMITGEFHLELISTVVSRDLTDAINQLKSNTSPLNPLPASFLKCVFNFYQQLTFCL